MMAWVRWRNENVMENGGSSASLAQERICQPARPPLKPLQDHTYSSLIPESDDLKALVDRLSDHPFIAVDAEFHARELRYWPDLCLIQVAGRDEAAAIDPKADGVDLKPLPRALHEQ